MYNQQPDFRMVIAGLGLVVLTKEATGLLISTNKSPSSRPPCPSSLLSDSQEWTERLYWTRWSWQQSVARTETSPPNEPRSLFTWIIGQQAILNPGPERGAARRHTPSKHSYSESPLIHHGKLYYHLYQRQQWPLVI